MAIGLQNTDNTEAPSSDYPYGRVKDNPGNQTGTPANRKTLGDFHQFFARLLDQAGIAPNGLPDNDYSGFQYYEALFDVLMGGQKTKEFEIGPWDMQNSVTVAINHGLDLNKIRSVSVIVRNDDNTQNFDFLNRDVANADIFVMRAGAVNIITATQVELIRDASGNVNGFDNSNFNNTAGAYNRGWITIRYVD